MILHQNDCPNTIINQNWNIFFFQIAYYGNSSIDDQKVILDELDYYLHQVSMFYTTFSFVTDTFKSAGVFVLHEWNEVKGIKKGHKKFHPSVYGWEDVYLSVLSVSFCLEKSWITFDGMKGSSLNLQDQSNSIQVIFGWRCQISRPQGHIPGLKTACF